mgnify:FL=1
MSDEIINLESRKPNDEDKFWVDFAREDFKDSFARLEEAAKFLITAVGVFAGLFTAALKVQTALKTPTPQELASWPFWLWAISAIFAVLVLMPLPYKHTRNAAEEIQRVYSLARWLKWGFLLISAVLFAAGVLVVAENL